jgi:hypothetical protein
MSQVIFKTEWNGKRVEVMAGWDAPMSFYHLTVFDPNPEPTAETDALWAEMDHHRISELDNVEIIKQDLAGLGIQPPPGFWNRVSPKCEGNIRFIWDEEHRRWK